MRAAIAASDAGATVTVLGSSQSSSFNDDSMVSGIASSAGESNFAEHAADTHRAGADLCEGDVVSSTTGSAVSHLAQLEQWGLNLRRDRNGSPYLGQLPGQSNPRTAGTGDSTLREVRLILEEQCIKRNIPRRGDIEILNIVMKNDSVKGLVALDVQTGEIFAIQSKALILADGGFQSAWNGDSSAMGSSCALALREGISLSNLEFTSMHPLTVADTTLRLPLDLLGSGGVVIGADGQPMSMDDGPDALARSIIEAGGAALDLTNISRSAATWFANVAENLQSRCGIDYSEAQIPLMPIANMTIGGIPTDGLGRVVNGGWDSTVEGLFAAGDAACSGLHGAALNSGDHLLGAIASGKSAGGAAATQASSSKFSGSSEISIALSEAHHMHDSMLSSTGSDGVSAGTIQSSLATTMQTHMGMSRSASGLAKAAASIQQLQETAVALSDSSPVMNTELVNLLRTQSLLSVASAAVSAAHAREESRGNHVRSDFPTTDTEPPSHSLTSMDGTVTSLPLRS